MHEIADFVQCICFLKSKYEPWSVELVYNLSSLKQLFRRNGKWYTDSPHLTMLSRIGNVKKIMWARCLAMAVPVFDIKWGHVITASSFLPVSPLILFARNQQGKSQIMIRCQASESWFHNLRDIVMTISTRSTQNYHSFST